MYITNKNCMVMMKSKYFQGSGSDIWGSHCIENGSREAQIYEMKHDTNLSAEFRSCCVKIKDCGTSFNLQTNETDVKIIMKGQNLFREYEFAKLVFLRKNLEAFPNDLQACSGKDDQQIIDVFEKQAQSYISLCKDVRKALVNEDVHGIGVWEVSEKLVVAVINLVNSILLQPFPKMFPRVVDPTDAGPCVSSNEKLVRFRICQESMICNYDYNARIHLGPGYSSNNDGTDPK